MMSAGLASSLAIPLAMLACVLTQRTRAVLLHLLPFAPVPALLAAIIVPEGTRVVLPQALLGITLNLDKPGAMLLAAASLLWIAGGICAREMLRNRADDGRFSLWWLTTLTGCLGVFIAVDMIGFYFFYTLVSLATYGLVVQDDTPVAHRAASLYVALALLGEAFLLMAFVMLAAATPDGSLLIHDAVASLRDSPWCDVVLILVILGFGLKIGLVPLHVWMPLTYSAAPVPAAAVLSGAAVKAGVIGLIRFLPFDMSLASWGEALAVLGFASAFYGVAIGVTQANPRAILAYSSVSQMGFLAAVLGMGLAAGNSGALLPVAFYALHHTLVKGGLFLAIGAASVRPRSLWLVIVPAAVLALGLAGLPLTGGQLAKLVVKGPLGDGLAGTFAQLSAAASALLMVHFLRCLSVSVVQDEVDQRAAIVVVTWLGVAIAAVVLPWMLFPSVVGTNWTEALKIEELWSAGWPVLTGALLAAVLSPWRSRLTRIPEGDVLVIAERCAPAVRRLGVAFEHVDGVLRQWSVATMCVALLVLVTSLALVLPR
jgi:formate hydrogenlyase subunit 3/multisubunit Na+/H+ antiporter MnhD subunit